MNNKISNPFLKQLISEIAVNANKGRISVGWGIVNEAKKKKVAEAEKQKPEEPAADAGGGLPDLGGTDDTPKDATATPPAGEQPAAEEPKEDAALEAGAADAADATPEEDPDKAKADAAKAKAELEKAKAEKEQAEKEIKDNSYVKLSSSGGTEFLLGKVLDHAFKTNTIDALAGEMVNSLKIETPTDMDNFSEDVVTYMTIPGIADLISSMKTLANKTPKKSEEEPTA